MNKRNRIQLLVALILCALSIVFAGFIQTENKTNKKHDQVML